MTDNNMVQVQLITYVINEELNPCTVFAWIWVGFNRFEFAEK